MVVGIYPGLIHCRTDKAGIGSTFSPLCAPSRRSWRRPGQMGFPELRVDGGSAYMSPAARRRVCAAGRATFPVAQSALARGAIGWIGDAILRCARRSRELDDSALFFASLVMR